LRRARLLIHGKNDRLNPVAAAYHLSTSLPAARLEVFGESGHAPFLPTPIVLFNS
jgi:pimeloyl-[acyl-carrier protein] methyl ester esterase